MTLLTTLSTCLQLEVLDDTAQAELYEQLTHSSCFVSYQNRFTSLINKRKQMMLDRYPQFTHSSLSTILHSPEYLQMVGDGATATTAATRELNLALEKVALKHFQSLGKMWAWVEVTQIQRHKTYTTQLAPGLSYIDSHYRGALIEDVAHSDLLVTSPHSEGLYSMSDAICLANLKLFVIEQSWYELLPLLHHSSQGCHFVLLHQPHPDTPPSLASSAMITDWTQRQRWLSFSPFFQHKQWQPLLNDRSLHLLNQTGAFVNLVPNNGCLANFDHQCREKVDSNAKLCEILRLTTAGSARQRLYLLYLAQKEMAQALHRAGYQCAYTIIENPWLLNFYAQLSDSAYINTGRYCIDHLGYPTYRGIWLVESFHQQYASIDFKQYQKMVRTTQRSLEVNDA
ncbi:N-(3-hydroxybutanoyl)-L- homoserine lactone synthase LuxM [Vibrio sp. JPW-9-11-11]|uniref:acyl-homoserine-lactone synthase n=1 Tax=Vibrio sp. JPW-9-11-11 TaxID=1416532 RepID=UPI0015946AA8|nr:acyl-homoserine-lactone synthase [Vibrio sp. JPW-9-11-11]NVD06431.1 N-(3-hydroxybutanoyl)-L- homoserine lactone synthase LuxM [Vibrio sp. JPW-9-11-11]